MSMVFRFSDKLLENSLDFFLGIKESYCKIYGIIFTENCVLVSGSNKEMNHWGATQISITQKSRNLIKIQSIMPFYGKFIYFCSPNANSKKMIKNWS